MKFELPVAIKQLVAARNLLKDHYRSSNLTFTFDGKLVGDLGEAIAKELFGLDLKSQAGIDGFAADGRSVQVKASGTGRGPAFRKLETGADHLICFVLDFESCEGEVVFNGPEAIALACLPETWSEGQREIPLSALRAANTRVPDNARLVPRRPSTE